MKKAQLLLCWLYIYKEKSTKSNCFQSPCFHFGPFPSCQLLIRTRLGQTLLYSIWKLTTGSCLKMSTREILASLLWCKKQPIKSQPSLWISLLPSRGVLIRLSSLLHWWRRWVEDFPWAVSVLLPPVLQRCLCCFLHQTPPFPRVNGKNTLELGKEGRKTGLSYVSLSDIKKCCSSVAFIVPGTLLQLPGCLQLPSSQYLALLWGSWNHNTRCSNSRISLTNFSSLKAAFFFTFTLHLYFEGVLLKCYRLSW